MKNGGATARALLCIGLAGCDLAAVFTRPPWPSKEDLEAFDTRLPESNRAMQIVEAFAVSDGISRVCGDFPVPPELRPGDDELKQLEDDLGESSHLAVLAAVERLHPGQPGNDSAAEHIWRLMVERGIGRGYEAAKARGCAAMQPADLAAWQALRAWPPQGQSGVLSR